MLGELICLCILSSIIISLTQSVRLNDFTSGCLVIGIRKTNTKAVYLALSLPFHLAPPPHLIPQPLNNHLNDITNKQKKNFFEPVQEYVSS